MASGETWAYTMSRITTRSGLQGVEIQALEAINNHPREPDLAVRVFYEHVTNVTLAPCCLIRALQRVRLSLSNHCDTSLD